MRFDGVCRLIGGGLNAIGPSLVIWQRACRDARLQHRALSWEGSSAHLMRVDACLSQRVDAPARRLYRATSEPERAAAQAILTKIHEGELHNGFTAREVHQHDWSCLTGRDQVQAGLNLLVELHRLAASSAAMSERGGRPTTTYTVNPRSWHNGYRVACTLKTLKTGNRSGDGQ